MRAILGDIHGNLEALDAVLADAEGRGAAEIYCVGDLVGYGPDSIACIERALKWNVVTLGNHDVLLDGQKIAFRRVEYEIETTVQKIMNLEDFDEMFAGRLLKGR